MRKLIDLTGQKFGKLTVIQRDNLTNKKDTYWLCECECNSGQYVSVLGYNLKNGHTNSCGCIRKEKTKNKKYNTYNLSEEYGIGWTTSGEEFYFDLEDYEKIKDYTWRFKDGYIVSTDNPGIRFHRLVTGANENEIIDHIDRNKQNNRKNNLRLATHQQNGFNIKKPVTNTSGIIGVCWHKKSGKWLSRIKHNDINYNLGLFSDINEAIKIRLESELKYFGLEFAPQRHLFEKYNIIDKDTPSYF